MVFYNAEVIYPWDNGIDHVRACSATRREFVVASTGQKPAAAVRQLGSPCSNRTILSRSLFRESSHNWAICEIGLRVCTVPGSLARARLLVAPMHIMYSMYASRKPRLVPLLPLRLWMYYSFVYIYLYKLIASPQFSEPRMQVLSFTSREFCTLTVKRKIIYPVKS